MPDKRIDEKFIDRAWEQMLATLDQEMPTEDKRRRVVLMPWRWAAAASVLLLLTVGAGWWLSQRSPQQSIAISTPAVADPVENRTANENSPEAKAIQKPAVAQQKQAQPTQESTTVDPRNSIAATSNNKLTGSKLASRKALEDKTTVNAIQQIADIMTSSVNTSDSDPKVAVSNIAIAKAQETAPVLPQSSTNANNQALSSLSALEIAMLEKQPADLGEKKSVPLWAPVRDEKESSSKWNIGVELATYSSAGSAVDGYAGGAVVDVPMPSEKLNLRTGLNFNSQQRYFDSNLPPQTDRTAGFGPSTVVVDPNPNFQVNAQQLSFPVTMEFKPRKSWGLEGGLQASYLLGARNLKGAEAYQTMAGLNHGNETIQTFVKSLSNAPFDSMPNADPSESTNTLNLDALRRFDVAVTAGFGYYPTQNIGVRLQYQRGLVDMLRSEQFKAFGNNVRLSAVYFFGK